jgi:hypothetical protein
MKSSLLFDWVMLLAFIYLMVVTFLIILFALKEITSILFIGR